MTYEYLCSNPECKHTWEAEQSIKDESLTICPKCQQETAKRLISNGNFILSGSGWFKSGGY